MHLPTCFTYSVLQSVYAYHITRYCQYRRAHILQTHLLYPTDRISPFKTVKVGKSNLVQVRRRRAGGHGRAGQDPNRGGTRPLLSFLVVRDEKGMWRIRLFGMGLGKGCGFGNGSYHVVDTSYVVPFLLAQLFFCTARLCTIKCPSMPCPMRWVPPGVGKKFNYGLPTFYIPPTYPITSRYYFTQGPTPSTTAPPPPQPSYTRSARRERGNLANVEEFSTVRFPVFYAPVCDGLR